MMPRLPIASGYRERGCASNLHLRELLGPHLPPLSSNQKEPSLKNTISSSSLSPNAVVQRNEDGDC